MTFLIGSFQALFAALYLTGPFCKAAGGADVRPYRWFAHQPETWTWVLGHAVLSCGAFLLGITPAVASAVLPSLGPTIDPFIHTAASSAAYIVLVRSRVASRRHPDGHVTYFGLLYFAQLAQRPLVDRLRTRIDQEAERWAGRALSFLNDRKLSLSSKREIVDLAVVNLLSHTEARDRHRHLAGERARNVVAFYHPHRSDLEDPALSEAAYVARQLDLLARYVPTYARLQELLDRAAKLV